uniref:DNA binding protein n=1 Tax=Dulem virus 115 TaxID=3145592 RepID=A0AAU8B6P5_9VIRU
MSRKKMSRGRDRKVFRRTAIKSKKINIDPKVYRGGIRL